MSSRSGTQLEDDLDDRAREAILELVTARGAGKTICPSEAARRIDPEDWRRHMSLTRRVAAQLADEGHITVFRKGKPVNIRTVKGVIRLGLPRAPESPGAEASQDALDEDE